jgi:ribonuclease Z
LLAQKRCFSSKNFLILQNIIGIGQQVLDLKNVVMANFDINILGCGSATPSLRHLPSAQVIDFRDKLFMIDCGEGAQLQMRRMKLKFSRLNHIFISHLHGDHFLGLPGLLSTLALHEVGGSVTIHTFPEGIDILQRLMRVFCHETSFEIIYHPISPDGGEVIVDDKSLTVETFKLYHRVPCVGFIFREKPKARHLKGDMVKFLNIPIRMLPEIKAGADYVTEDGRVFTNDRLTTPADPVMSYAYCSDTIYSPKVIEAIKGVHTIYHESTYGDDKAHLAKQRGHSTARQAGQVAAAAGVEQLIIGHYSKSYLSDEELLSQAREEFKNVIAANEGMKISLL